MSEWTVHGTRPIYTSPWAATPTGIWWATRRATGRTARRSVLSRALGAAAVDSMRRFPGA
ncbi:hypothetical protein ACFYPN_13895 [Streptomyces sp. NPDC005576]|uniref:hypothetical protein n=1 Tax=unclassified Streptomyces TaxID=2593676 RepID=UPI0033EB1049